MVDMRFRAILGAADVVLSMVPENPRVRCEEIGAVEFFEEAAEAVMGVGTVQVLMEQFVLETQLLVVIPCAGSSNIELS